MKNKFEKIIKLSNSIARDYVKHHSYSTEHLLNAIRIVREEDYLNIKGITGYKKWESFNLNGEKAEAFHSFYKIGTIGHFSIAGNYIVCFGTIDN